MNIKFAKRAALRPSPIFILSSKVARMREAGHDIISLALGETEDIDTPLHIKAAAIEAIESGKTKYTPIDGIPMLKQAICQKLLQENDLEYNPYQVIASTGAKQAIHNAMMCLLDEGDEAILLAPYWASYYDNVKMTGATPVVLQTTLEDNFKITAEQLEAAITDKTRVVVLNTPSNPSGQHYTPNELKKIAKVLLKHPDIILMSDEIYEHIRWDDAPYQNILNVCPKLMDQTLIINGLSKAFAMTGWRMGYAAGPAELIEKMKSVQSQSTSCPCSIAQYAAVEALDGNQKVVAQSAKALKARHDKLYAFLSELDGCEVIPADGTYYLFPRVTQIIEKLALKDDVALAEHILDKAGISVLPGTIFGCPGHLRISFVGTEDKITEATKRIKALLTKDESDSSST